MRSALAMALILASFDCQARLPRRSGIDVKQSDWIVAVFHTEKHFRPQFFGFGQRGTNWEVLKVDLYRKGPFGKTEVKSITVKKFPENVYYDGKENWWYGAEFGTYGDCMRFSAKKMRERESKIIHDP